MHSSNCARAKLLATKWHAGCRVRFMKRILMLIYIFGPAIVISLSVHVARSVHASSIQATAATNSGRLVVPAGTVVRIRLVQGVTAGTKAGEDLEAVTAEPSFAGT